MRVGFLLALLAVVGFVSCAAIAQTTIATGGIVGTVTNASDAVVRDAKVTITGPTGQTVLTTTNEQGKYSAGLLTPGLYSVRVEVKGSKTTRLAVHVRVGNSANGNVKLQAGPEAVVLDEQTSEFQVNTQQPTVQGVLTAPQFEQLPLNGRNFLDLAQLEPGVQFQDGMIFDPSKVGYASASFVGRLGRTARIEVDGADISDETVGTITTNIPASGIQEFQIAQASMDLSTELTSSGSTNVITKSGGRGIHGEAFGQFRDNSIGAAALPGGVSVPFQRSQYGGDVGGSILPNKLFFFADGERTKQDAQTPVAISAPFQAYSGRFSDPFREDDLMGRLDYQLTNSARLFYRYSYFTNSLPANFGSGYSVYDNKDLSRDHLVGLDFSRGALTHSIRFSYLKFQNQIADATSSNNALPFNDLGAEIFMGATGLIAGPSRFAPQSRLQSDLEIAYDGSKVFGTHIFRFGATLNHLQGGGFASLYKNGPSLSSRVTPEEITAAANGPFPGGSANPFNYPADGGYVLGNGLGYSTADSAFGFPAGGLGPDNRLLLYIGDSWKVKTNFTLSYGVRYERDTDRSDSQYAPIPVLNSLVAGLGDRITQPNKNFAPQVGLAWDPAKNGRTSIRGGVGLFWENALWNNVLADAALRQSTGSFLQTPSPCSAAGSPSPIQTSSGTITASSAICGGASGYPLIGNALPALLALQQQLQAASPLNLHANNPAYAGQYLTDCGGGTNCFFAPGNSMLNPNYRSPRSIVMNLGIQREVRPGTVLSVDFIRNVQTHYLLGVDENHAGDASTFNVTAAQQAIAATLLNCGVASLALAETNCPDNPVTGAAGYNAPATMADFAANGLGSSTDMGGNSCIAALGRNCAFPGINPNAPPLRFLSPVGRSVYDGLQMKLIENVKNPFRGAQALNFQLAYVLSRFKNSGGGVAPDAAVTAASADQDFIVPALNNNNVNGYFGPSTMDRTHQVSLGGTLDVRGGFQLGIMSHFYSPLSTTLTVPDTGLGAGEIFRTDFTGDGTTQDPIPGTKVGNFDRGIDASSINNVISKYNASQAGQPTPAGNVLIAADLMTAADLSALGGVAPVVPGGACEPSQLHLAPRL